MSELCPMPGCRVEAIPPSGPDLLHVDAHGTRPGGRCPECGRASRSVHSRYRRRPADLPSLRRWVRLALRVRRFYYYNPLHSPHFCRTAAGAGAVPRAPNLPAGEAQGRVGVTLGGEAGTRLLRRLAMPVSADTVLRLVRRMVLLEAPPPRVLAIDDWALRKGRTYGTIVADLERRRVSICWRTAPARRWQTGCVSDPGSR